MAFFEDLAEKYEDFILSLEDRGVPNPRVLVPALIAITVAAIGFAAWTFLIAPAAAPKAEMKVVVFAEEKPFGNASVSLFLEKEFVDSAVTDASGIAVFSVEPDKMYRVEVTAPGYKKATQESTPTTLEVSLEREVAVVGAVLSFAVKDQAGVPVTNALVEVRYDGEVETTWTGYDGIASIEAPAAPEHATVAVKKDGFASESKDYGKDLLLASAAAPLEITLNLQDSPDRTSPTLQEKGTLIVDVTSDGRPVGGALVALVDATTNSKYAAAKTFDDGLASVENVDYGKSFYVNVEDPAGRFQPYSSAEAFEFTPDSTVLKVALQPTRAGAVSTLRIAVKSSAGEALAESEVFIFDSASNVFIERGSADDAGIAVFKDLSTKLVYYATAWHEGFLPAHLANVKAGDSRIVALEEEATGNYGVVSASVVETPLAGTEELPVENAEVALFIRGGAKSGRFLGIPPALTDASGSAFLRIPLKIEGQSYSLFAKASKESLAGESDSVQASEDVQLKVVVSQPSAKIVAKVKDALEEIALAGAVVAAKTEGIAVASCTTDEKGECVLEVPPSDSIELSAKLKGYLESLATVAIASKESKAVELALYASARVNAARARFLGFFDRRGRVSEAAAGEVYATKFEVAAPAGTERVGLYVRVGKASSAEEDFVVLRDWDVVPLQYTGASYDAADPCREENYTTEEKKWVELVWPRGFSGTRTVAVNVFVKPSASPGEKIEVAYRAYALQKNLVSFSPSDEELASRLLGEVNVSRQELCKAKEARSSVEVSQQAMSCSNEVCYRIWFEDLETRAQGVDGFAATLGKEIAVHYEIYSSIEIEKLGVQSAYLKASRIEPELASFAAGSAAAAGDYASFVAEEDLAGEEKEQAFLVSIPANRKSRGKIYATPVLPGQRALLNVLMHPVGAQPAVAAVKWFYVGGAGALVVRVLSSQVDVALGGEQRVLAVTVSDRDGRPVKDASITVFDGEGTPLEGREVNVVGDGTAGNGEDGKYRIALSPRKLGFLGIRVSRDGFRKYESSNVVEVVAAKWFEVEPTSLAAFADDTKAEKQIITLRSYVDARASVTYSAKCYFADGTTKSGSSVLRIISSGKIDNSRDLFAEVWVKENVTAKATCEIKFVARISPKQAAEQSVVFDVDVKSPYAYKEEKVPCVPLTAPFVITINEYGNFETQALCLQYAGVAITNIEVRGPMEYLGFVSLSPSYKEGFFYASAFFGDARLVDESAVSGRVFLFVTLETGRTASIPIFVRKFFFGTTVYKEYRFGLKDAVEVVIDPCKMEGTGTIGSDTGELILTSDATYCKLTTKPPTTPYGEPQGLASFSFKCILKDMALDIDRNGIEGVTDMFVVGVPRAQRSFNVPVKFRFDASKAEREVLKKLRKTYEIDLRQVSSGSASFTLCEGNRRDFEWERVDEDAFKSLGLNVEQDRGRFGTSASPGEAYKEKLRRKLEETKPFEVWFDGRGYGVKVRVLLEKEEPGKEVLKKPEEEGKTPAGEPTEKALAERIQHVFVGASEQAVKDLEVKYTDFRSDHPKAEERALRFDFGESIWFTVKFCPGASGAVWSELKEGGRVSFALVNGSGSYLVARGPSLEYVEKPERFRVTSSVKVDERNIAYGTYLLEVKVTDKDGKLIARRYWGALSGGKEGAYSVIVSSRIFAKFEVGGRDLLENPALDSAPAEGVEIVFAVDAAKLKDKLKADGKSGDLTKYGVTVWAAGKSKRYGMSKDALPIEEGKEQKLAWDGNYYDEKGSEIRDGLQEPTKLVIGVVELASPYKSLGDAYEVHVKIESKPSKKPVVKGTPSPDEAEAAKAITSIIVSGDEKCGSDKLRLKIAPNGWIYVKVKATKGQKAEIILADVSNTKKYSIGSIDVGKCKGLQISQPPGKYYVFVEVDGKGRYWGRRDGGKPSEESGYVVKIGA